MKSKKNKGFTLTEILLVLVIAAAIVISAFIIYPKVRISNQIQKEMLNITNIVSASKEIYGSKADYEGWDLTVLSDAGLLPDDMKLENGYEFVNTWKSVVRTGIATSSDGFFEGFSLMYVVPKDICTKLTTAVYPIADQIYINGSIEIKSKDKIQMNVSEIANSCSESYDGNNNKIEFFFF